MTNPMSHRASVSAIAIAIHLSLPLAGLCQEGEATLALLPVQNRVGDVGVAELIERSLLEHLRQSRAVLEPQKIRPWLRRHRIRSVNDAPPPVMRQLGRQLDSDVMLSVIVHEAILTGTPRLSLSARGMRTTTGEVFWSAFVGTSGLDHRKLLGLGVLHEIEALCNPTVEALMASLDTALLEAAPDAPPPSANGLGRIAVVPLTGYIRVDASIVAETATAALHSTLFDLGIPTISPNRVAEILRHQRVRRWGELSPAAREALSSEGQAELAITGSVEAHETGGGAEEPNPRVSVALRLLDLETGKIVWTGALELSGWDRAGVFRVGRIFSAGTLLKKETDDLLRDLVRQLSRSETSSKGPR